MVTSLMSIFDPSPSQSFFFGLGIYWYVFFFYFFFQNTNFWIYKSSFFFSLSKITSYIFQSLNSKGFFIISMSVFYFIFFFNFLGLTPMSFCLTSQFFFHFPLSMMIWFSPLLLMVKKKWSSFTSHFMPMGAPLFLAPLLVPIEMVSMLIRPFALSLRLMANMVAGHMILALMQEGIKFLSLPSGCCCFFFTIFEVGVSLIQSYVFSSLLYLYWKESSLS